MRSCVWLASAWPISCPITCAISSSLALSFSISPVYIAILPPAMQKAFTVFGSLISCTSQFHFAESGRKRTACANSRKLPREPPFALPPLWIHEPLACFLGKESPLLIPRRREARRRALLQMLDRLPIRSERHAPVVQQPAAAPVDLSLPRTAPGAAPGAQK